MTRFSGEMKQLTGRVVILIFGIKINICLIPYRCFISAKDGTVYAFVGPFALILVVRYFSSSFVVRGSNIANYLFYSYAYFPGA